MTTLPSAMTPVVSSETRLYIGNLPYTSTQLELREWILTCGITPLRVDIPRGASGRHPGFAFVNVSAENGEQAIQSLSGRVFRSRKIKVQPALPRPTRRDSFDSSQGEQAR